MKCRSYLAAAFSSVILVSGYAHAQNPKNPAPAAVLPDAGKALEAKYNSAQTALKVEIEKALPKLDEAKLAAWLQAIQAEEGPAKETAVKAKEVAKVQGAEANLRRMEENLKYGPKTLEDAQAELARARARGEGDPEKAKLLKSSESFLASRQKEIDKLKAGIEKARKEVEEAKVKLPAAIKAAEAAKQAHEKAMAATWQAMDALGVSGVLSSSALDAELAQHVILKDATATGLAEFAQQSPENQKLVDQLLADKDLMAQMLVAAISAEPELLVLDEPTSGLDPIVRREFIQTVIGAYQEADPARRTVLVSTHLITEFEGLIDEFTIVDAGRAVLTLEADAARSRYQRIRARFGGTPPELKLPGVLRTRVTGREVEFIANGASAAILEQLRALKPDELVTEALTLEEIFMVTLQ